MGWGGNRACDLDSTLDRFIHAAISRHLLDRSWWLHSLHPMMRPAGRYLPLRTAAEREALSVSLSLSSFRVLNFR
jgi:hypothetical protein